MNQTIPEILAALDQAKTIVASKADALSKFDLMLVVDAERGHVTLWGPSEVAERIDVVVLRPDDPDPYSGRGGPHNAVLVEELENRFKRLVREDL